MKHTIGRFLAFLLSLCMVLTLMPVMAFAEGENTAKIGTTEYKTLQAAVEAAKSGDVVEIILADTYTVPNLPLNITLKGAAEGIVFNCVGTGSIASIPNGASFENVTFNMGTANYHGFQHAGKIVMKDCSINGKFFNYGTVEFVGCTFNAPASDYSMWIYGGDAYFDGCIFNGEGKFFNVFNEGNSATPWKVVVKNCVANNTGTENKAVFNVKETSGTAVLKYEVELQGTNVAIGAFPAAGTIEDGGKDTQRINPFVQVADKNDTPVEEEAITVAAAEDAKIASFENGAAYEAAKNEGKVEENAVAVPGNVYETPAPAYAAQISTTKYLTLQEAFNEVTEGQTIQLLPGTIEQGTVKLPASLKNVTIKGAADHQSILKGMVISSADGIGYHYENVTIDGVVFDDSYLVVTGGRKGEMTNKNWKFTNNVFRNLAKHGDGYSALHFASLGLNAPAENITVSGNIAKDFTFSSGALLNISSVTGNIIFTDNDVSNLLWRPANIQIQNNDAVADAIKITDSTFENNGSAPQILGRYNDGEDDVNALINANKIIQSEENTASAFIFYNVPAAKVTADFTGNYYSKGDKAKIYFMDASVSLGDNNASAALPHANSDSFTYYTKLTEDGEIDTSSEVERVFAEARIGETYYTTLEEAIYAANGREVVLLESRTTGDVVLTKAASFAVRSDMFNKELLKTAAGKELCLDITESSGTYIVSCHEYYCIAKYTDLDPAADTFDAVVSGHAMGKLTLEKAQNGWYIKDASGYIVRNGSSVSHSSTPQVWQYAYGKFYQTVTEKVSRGWVILNILFGKKTVTTDYYLASASAGVYTVNTSALSADFVLNKTVSEPHHSAAETYKGLGNGTHVKACSVCGAVVDETPIACEYINGACKYCGLANPNYNGMFKIAVKTHTTNLLFFKLYSATALVSSDIVGIKSVKIANNVGGTALDYTTGKITSTKPLSDIVIVITTYLGDSYALNYHISNGAITPYSLIT